MEDQGGGRAVEVAGGDAWREGEGWKGLRIGVGDFWFCHGVELGEIGLLEKRAREGEEGL